MLLLCLSRGVMRSTQVLSRSPIPLKSFLPASSSLRFYSQQQEGVEELPGLTAEQIEKVGMRDAALRESYKVMEDGLSAEERDSVRRKRMIYRSKQRGWLEADLLMGSWAMKNIPLLSSAELDEYELLLQEETIDIYNYISGKDELPSHLKKLGVMKKMQEYALSGNMDSPEGYESVKRETNLT